MHREAILINVSRGPIVDTEALTAALAAGQIAGAGLDVFDPEPLPADHPLLGMDNVVLSPHALAWTDEMAMGNGSSAVAAILAVRDGKRPIYLANPAVMNHQRFQHRTREGDR
jgi:phosphoglycerate dehydrogenase-like enzyme